jgi:tryptophan synthase beta subunit
MPAAVTVAEIPDQFDQEWEFVSYKVQDVSSAQATDWVFRVNGTDAAITSSAEYLRSRSLKLQNVDAAGTAYFLVESEADTVQTGGDGPKKAIARVNDNGDLEIIAALSAGYDYPAGFEDAVKADSGCWIFKSAEQ